MATRFAAFNVENLFSRPKAMNLSDHSLGTDILDIIAKLQRELAKTRYDKTKIASLALQARGYFEINKTRGKNPLSYSSETKLYSVKVNGRNDWDGFIDLKRANFNYETVKNTGAFIRSLKPDILSLCEVEGSAALRRFRTDQLNTLGLKYDLLIDGNDPRGIDVAILSKEELGYCRTNIHRKETARSRRRLFSRDCLEVEIVLNNGESLWILQNHLLSKLKASNDARRKRQAKGIADILNDDYDLQNELVIVSGDFNDDIENAPLKPLRDVPALRNALDVMDIPREDQWTYYYGRERARNRIDYVLVSDALAERILDAGVNRRGIAGLGRITDGEEASMPGITNWRNAASDHAAVWVDFDF